MIRSFLLRNVLLSGLDFSARIRWPLLKLFLVGDGGAGKTSVVRAMRRQKFVATASTDGAEASTFVLGSGADLSSRDWEHLVDAMRVELRPSNKHAIAQPASSSEAIRPAASVSAPLLKESRTRNKGAITYSAANASAAVRRRVVNERIVTVWDLAGQSQYFSSHRHFFSRRALYVIVINLHPESQQFHEVGVKLDGESVDDLLRRRCKFWCGYIQLKAPGERRVVVYTHADSGGMSAAEVWRRVDLCRAEMLGAAAYVVVGLQSPKSAWARTSSIAPDIGVGMSAVVAAIERQFDEITKADESRYPIGWILLARELLQHADRGRLLLRWAEVQDIARLCGVGREDGLRRALAAITQTTAVHVLVEQPGPYLFLRCQWLADLFRVFVTKDECLARRLDGSPISKAEIDVVKRGEMTEAAVQHVWYNFLEEKLRGKMVTNALSVADIAILGAFPVATLLQSFHIMYPIGDDRFVLPARIPKRDHDKPDLNPHVMSLEVEIPLTMVPAELEGQLYASIYAHPEVYRDPAATSEGLAFRFEGAYYVTWIDARENCARLSNQAAEENGLSSASTVSVALHIQTILIDTGFALAQAAIHCSDRTHSRVALVNCGNPEIGTCPCIVASRFLKLLRRDPVVHDGLPTLDVLLGNSFHWILVKSELFRAHPHIYPLRNCFDKETFLGLLPTLGVTKADICAALRRAQLTAQAAAYEASK